MEAVSLDEERRAPPMFESDGSAQLPFYFRPLPEAGDVALPPLRTETYRTADRTKEVTLTLSRVFLSYIVKVVATGAETPVRTLPVANFLTAVRSETVLRIVYYPLDKKNNCRRQCTLDFEMNSPEHAHSWTESINGLLMGRCSRRRHVLVLVNPFGGTRKAPTFWKNIVKPVLDMAGVTYEALETEYQGHARQIAERLDLTKYDALATLSGDGLFWELLNGLLMRPDWEEAVKLPLIPLPGGSSNALAYAAGYKDVETAAFTLARGFARPLDIATVRQETHRCMSFLAVSWGIVADVDFESERFRWMGEARYTMTAMKRIASLRGYRGRVSYYPDKGFDMDSAHQCAGRTCSICVQPKYSGPPSMSMDAKEPDQAAVGPGKDAFTGLEKNSLPPGPSSPLIDALESGDESGWVHIDSDAFVMVTASNVTHIASDMMTAPYAHWSDGSWDIVVVKDVPKMALMKLFLAIEKGEHIDSPHVTYIKCKAFRIEPQALPDVESFLDVDGERLPVYGPTSVEVHRGLVNLITM